MSVNPLPNGKQALEAFEDQVSDLRPKLHRYCARMIGSAIDAEDVLQEALASAYLNWPDDGLNNPEAWIFRIAHNRAIDYLRRRDRVVLESLDEVPVDADSVSPLEQREMAGLALSAFMALTPTQRASVILKDVLGYSNAEISELLDMSVGAIKAALFRARENLRQMRDSGSEFGDLVPIGVDDADRGNLETYIDRFTRHDFDGIRDLLVDDVRLDLVHRVHKKGAHRVGQYFSNYQAIEIRDARAVTIEGRPAMLIVDDAGCYPILLTWRDDRIAEIRDFRYARYVMDSVPSANGVETAPA